VERIKLILQVSIHLFPEDYAICFQLQNAQTTIQQPYKGLVDCLLRVPHEQGFLSFWRGNWSNILRASSQVTFNFYAYAFS
jgi:solute carrier family 25 (adenine nucleotide translocator) protein 4/5/6/31